VHGRKTTKKVVEKSGSARKGRSRNPRNAADAKPQAASDTGANVRTVTESFGLFKNPPRSLRTEIERYLREREADADWFDGTVLIARKAMKRLYAVNHVKPGERAQKILFD